MLPSRSRGLRTGCWWCRSRTPETEPRIALARRGGGLLLADELNARGLPAIRRAERVACLRAAAPAAGRRAQPRHGHQGRAAGRRVGGDRRRLTRSKDDQLVGRSAQHPHRRRTAAAGCQRARRRSSDLFGIFRARGRTAVAWDACRCRDAASGAPAARGVRELHQGADGRERRHAGDVSRDRRSSESRVRPRPAGALGGPPRSGGSRGCARRRAQPCRRTSPLARAGAFPRRRVAAGAEALRRGVRRLQEAARSEPAAGHGLRRRARSNNLGVVQHSPRRDARRRAGHVTSSPRPPTRTPADPDYLFNLGYAYVLEQQLHGGASTGCAKRCGAIPHDADAHYVLAAALQASGSGVEAARETELARQLSSRNDELESARGRRSSGPARPRAPAQDPSAASARSAPDQAIVNTAQREQRELAAFHLDRGRRLFEREEDREAMAELRRAVYLSPYEAQAHLLIGRIHLRAGRPQDAIDALKISDLEPGDGRGADRACRGVPEAAEQRPRHAPSWSGRWCWIRSPFRPSRY